MIVRRPEEPIASGRVFGTAACTLRWLAALLGVCVLLCPVVTVASVTAVTPAREAAPPFVVPAPARYETTRGHFSVTTNTTIRVAQDADTRWIADHFVALVHRTRGLTLPINVQPGRVSGPQRDIVFAIEPGAASRSPEGYTLAIAPEGVMVSAIDRRGLLYGAITLWQLMSSGPGRAEPADRDLPLRASGVSLPALRIVDEPRYAWRGLMLDSARHYQSPEFIEQYIDWMSLHKLNVLHWHLVDDQGWRLEIRKYPRLTSVGAWRVPAGAGPAADIDPATGKPRLYGGYYTQDTVRRLVRYADERGVTIVPEIEMPGHATAAIVAYPELGVVKDVPTTLPADWGIYPNLFNVEDSTFAFLEDVLREVIELFPSPYIHVGGDEAVKDQWQASPRVQERMRELGIHDEHALQSWFVQRIGRFLSANGRRLVGWDEILEGGLAPDATVMSWRGIDGAVAAAAAGHDAVLAAWPTLYFDNRQGSGPQEPPGRGRVISLADVYAFDPAPAAIPADARQHILGLQANLWTEHVRTEPRVEWMSFPRAAAVAELAWSPPERIDFADFKRRLDTSLRWYDAVDLHYATTEFASPATAAAGNVSSAGAMLGVASHAEDHVGIRKSQQLQLCSDRLTLSLEDDAPVHGERAVFLIDIMNPCWLWPGADLEHGATLTARVAQVPFNFQIGKDVEKILLRPPATADGELEVRLDGCDGEHVASLPLAPAVSNPAVTTLPVVKLEPRAGRHDLCFTFTSRAIDPMWAIDSLELAEGR
jgi:hexosaminidase